MMCAYCAEEAEEFIKCIKEAQRLYRELNLLYQRTVLFCPKYANNHEWQGIVGYGNLGPYPTTISNLIAVVRNLAEQERLAKEAEDAQK